MNQINNYLAKIVQHNAIKCNKLSQTISTYHNFIIQYW